MGQKAIPQVEGISAITNRRRLLMKACWRRGSGVKTYPVLCLSQKDRLGTGIGSIVLKAQTLDVAFIGLGDLFVALLPGKAESWRARDLMLSAKCALGVRAASSTWSYNRDRF